MVAGCLLASIFSLTRRVAGGLGGLALTGPLVRLVAGSHVSNAIGTGRSRVAAPCDPRARGFWQPFVQKWQPCR